MFKLKNLSIRNKLLVTCSALILISNIAIGIPAIYISTHTIIKNTSYYIENNLEQISNNIDINLRQINQATLSIYSNEMVSETLRKTTKGQSYANSEIDNQIKDILASIVITRDDIDSAFLYDNRGFLWGSRDNESEKIFSYEEAKEIGDIGRGRMIWAEPQNINNIEIPGLRNINNTSVMEPDGILIIYVKESSLRNIYSSSNMKIDAVTYIINENGDIISCTNKKRIGEKLGSQLLDKMKKPSGNFLAEKTEDLVIYNSSSFNDWRYVYVVNQGELTKGIDSIRYWILLSMALFTLASFFITLLVSKSISTPINRVVKELEKIDKHNFSININYSGKDEIYVLVNTINLMLQKIRNLIKQVYIQTIFKQEQELKMLQAQINPHFLYNTLESINWMGRIDNNTNICEMTTLLGDIMRYSIKRDNPTVYFYEEFEYIKKYLRIQKIRFGDKISVFYDIPDDILNSKIPKLTIQPIVENAIVHGLQEKLGHGKIRILGRLNEIYAQIIIEDNGNGIEQGKLEKLLVNDQNELILEKKSESKHTKIGLSNVHRRIKLSFGNNYGVTVRSEVGKGTRITLNLPLPEGRMKKHV